MPRRRRAACVDCLPARDEGRTRPDPADAQAPDPDRIDAAPASVAFKAAIAEVLEGAVWPEFEADRIAPVVDRVFPLAQAAEAHRRMEAGDHVGKIVLGVGVK